MKAVELLSESSFALSDLVYDQGLLQYKLIDNKQKDHGAISLQNQCVQDYFSFLDLVLSANLQLIPIIAVDFSLANLTFDIENKCLHTLKPDA